VVFTDDFWLYLFRTAIYSSEMKSMLRNQSKSGFYSLHLLPLMRPLVEWPRRYSRDRNLSEGPRRLYSLSSNPSRNVNSWSSTINDQLGISSLHSVTHQLLITLPEPTTTPRSPIGQGDKSTNNPPSCPSTVSTPNPWRITTTPLPSWHLRKQSLTS
jgi:hypothetical protein